MRSQLQASHLLAGFEDDALAGVVKYHFEAPQHLSAEDTVELRARHQPFLVARKLDRHILKDKSPEFQSASSSGKEPRLSAESYLEPVWVPDRILRKQPVQIHVGGVERRQQMACPGVHQKLRLKRRPSVQADPGLDAEVHHTDR